MANVPTRRHPHRPCPEHRGSLHQRLPRGARGRRPHGRISRGASKRVRYDRVVVAG